MMDKKQEHKLLEEVYRNSYCRKKEDAEFAKTHSEALMNLYFRTGGYINGLKEGVKCVLPLKEADRMLFLMDAVEWSGEDDWDEGEEMDVQGAIQLARKSWEEQKEMEAQEP